MPTVQLHTKTNRGVGATSAPRIPSAREGVTPILHRDAGMVGIAVSVGQEEGGQVGFQHMYVFLPQPSTVVQQTRW